VIVEVFVAQCDADDTLHRQGFDGMFGEHRVAAVLEAGGKAAVRPSTLSVAPSNSAPASDVMAPASKPAVTPRPSTRAKLKRVGLHSVGIEGFLCLAGKPLLQKHFLSVRAPMHLIRVRNAG
jgi:hypothetical protein